jgi:hypothetical protein
LVAHFLGSRAFQTQQYPTLTNSTFSKLSFSSTSKSQHESPILLPLGVPRE